MNKRISPAPKGTVCRVPPERSSRPEGTRNGSLAPRGGVTEVIIIDLPLPPKECWPNRQRVHWRVRWKAQREAHGWAEIAAMQAAHEAFGVPWEQTWWRRCTVEIVFRWPDARKRDLDGAVGACKPYLDAMTTVGIYQDDSAIARLTARAVVDRVNPGVTITVRPVSEGEE